MSNNPFLEERLNVDSVLQGASYGDEYAVEITRTSNDQEHRRLVHPFPVRRFRLSYLTETSSVYSEVLNLYHRAYGKFKGFRVKCLDDFSTNGQTGTPTFSDQTLARLSAGVYQLSKVYGTSGAVRTIFKPVTGTTKIAVNGVEKLTGITVDTTTGQVTLTPAPLISDTVTGGCEFDLPVRFDTTVDINQGEYNLRTLDGVELVELINP